MSLTPAELEVVAGVRQAYDTAVEQFAIAASRSAFPLAERWATIAFSLLEALDEKGRTYA